MNFLNIALFAASLTAAVAVESAAVTVFTPEQFGGSPHAEDNSKAFRAMIGAAITSEGPVEILLSPNAAYRIGASQSGSSALTIKDAKNLTFNGQGATLLITDPLSGGISVQNSQNIVLKDFFVDYDPLPYTQGAVTAINLDEYWFEYRVDDGHLEPNAPSFERAPSQSVLIIQERDDGGRQYGPAVMTPEKIVPMGDRRWRIYVKRADRGYTDPIGTSGMAIGDVALHSARNYAQAVSARDCDDIVFEGITVYAAPRLGFYPRGNKNEIIRDCHIAIKDGRIFSVTADGIHMRGSRGNVLIENCTFEGGGDDAINVHSSAIPVTAQPQPNQVLARKHTYSVRKGDRLEAISQKDAAFLGVASVVQVEDRGDSWLITLDSNLELPDLTGKGKAQLNAHGLPTTLVNLYNLDESATPFVIRNCTFNDFRGRGILVSARDGLIEDNIFRVREGWGVVMNYESSRWAEGPVTKNLTIKNNEFQRMSNGGQAAIRSRIVTGERGRQPKNAFDHIRVENNVFTGWDDPLDLRFVENLQVKDNKIIKSQSK